MHSSKAFLLVLVLSGFMGCSKGEPGQSADQGKPLEHSYEAQEIFQALDNYFGTLEAQWPEGDLGAVAFPGSGSATAVGSKKVSQSSSSYSSRSSTLIDAFVDFREFTPEGTTMIVHGPVRFFSYVRSRTACAGASCSSSYKNSRAIETRPELNGDIEFAEVTFQLSNGEWIHDRLAIDASSPEYTRRWISVAIRTESGRSFSL